MTLQMTAAEYSRWRASLPRGPLGPLWPGGCPPVVLIVPEPRPAIDRALVTAAARYAAAGRS